MVRAVDQSVLDAGLTDARNATEIFICNAQPASGADAAINAVRLHVAPITAAPTALENGAPTGSRQFRNPAVNAVTLDNVDTNPGPVTHVATRVGQVLKVVTTTASTPVNQNDVVDLGEWLYRQLQPPP